MLFQFNFYSSFLLIFFVHTLVYSVLFYLRFIKEKVQAARWMSIFLLLAALYIAPWMLGFAGWYDQQPYRDILFYFPFQHLFLIGPTIYCYVSSLFNPQFRITGKYKWHFVPALLYAIFCVIMFVYDKWVVHQYYFLQNQEDPDFDHWYQLTGFISMIIYFIASIKYYYSYKKAIEAVISNAADFLFIWVRNFLVAFLCILIAWVCVALFTFIYNTSYAASWWYFLGFSLCCYYIAIAGFSNSVATKIFLEKSFFSNNQHIFLPVDKGSTLSIQLPIELDLEENQLATDAVVLDKSWRDKIELLMTNKKLYQLPELSLLDMAQHLEINVSLLSKLINQLFYLNFNDFVNKFRTQHFIELLEKGEHKKQTLLSLAFECGFNSKTTFNRAFKKYTGSNPLQYIKKHHL